MDGEYRGFSDFPGYRISEGGLIQTSLPWRGSGDGWRVLKPTVDKKSGYHYVKFSKDGRTFKQYVHRLVLEAFVGPCPPGLEACHKDGDRSNNCLSNLRWGTRKSNHGDKLAHGTDNRGEKSPVARLTDEKVMRICERWMETPRPTMEALGIEFGVAASTIQNILHGHNWAWLTQGKFDTTHRTKPRILEFNGESKSMTEWAKSVGIKFHTLLMRIEAGWSVEKALMTPVRRRIKS